MVQRRTKNNDFYNRWNATANYFSKENVEANKKATWESNKSFESSMNAWKSQHEKEAKTLNLKRRRLKLAEMLRQERDRYKEELAGLSLNLNFDDMKERSETLRSAREERRQRLADGKLLEHLRINNPDIRQLEQKQHEQHVITQWSKQEEHRKEQQAEEQRLKEEFERDLLQKEMAALQLQKQHEQERIEEEKALKDILKNQMFELKDREKESLRLKQQEELLMQEQWELGALEEKRRAMEKERKKLEFGRVLLRQHAAALRRRSQQVQKELEEDLVTLVQLSVQEKADHDIQTARREKAQTDARWMKQVVEEQIRLEKAREAELDMLYQDEAAKVWHEREAEWTKERVARERLMNEVLEGRQEQIQQKLDSVKQQQQDSIERREEILQDLEMANQLTRREEEDKERQKSARKVEIEAQITSRQETHYTSRQKLEQELEEEKQAEQDYQQFLDNEAQRIQQRGFQPKDFGRKQAWM